MADVDNDRPERLADQYQATQDGFTRLVESLTDDQWRMIGKNSPRRMNDEDEDRPVGVIAHHAASSSEWIMERIQLLLDGRPLPPVDFQEINARHAIEHRQPSREEVVRILRESGPRIAAAVRRIPADQLDTPRETPVGPMSIAQRLEMVLIGHLQAHQASIEAAISEP